MNRAFWAIIGVCLLGGPVAAAPPASDTATKIFAPAPDVIPLKQFKELPLQTLPGEYLQQEATIRQQLQEKPGDKQLAKKLAGIQEMKANAQAAPIGVFLAGAKFPLDRPAYAYFAVRNTTDKPLNLDMRLDLHAGMRAINSCSVDLRPDATSDTPGRAIQISAKEWHCGGPPLVRLEPHGVYCVRADLRKLGATSPGHYTLQWRRRGILSQQVRFAMLPAKVDELRQQSNIRVAQITPNPQAMNVTGRVPDPLPPPRLANAQVKPIPADRFAATLATGVGENIYPDILGLPHSDKFITATASLESYKGEMPPRKLVLKLTPRQKNPGLFLDNYEHLYLIATSDDPEALQDRSKAREDIRKMRAIRMHKLSDPGKPLSIEIELPANWPHLLNLAGDVKLQVLISSHRLKLQGDYPQIEALQMKLERAAHRPWEGLLCTPAVEVQLEKSSSR